MGLGWEIKSGYVIKYNSQTHYNYFFFYVRFGAHKALEHLFLEFQNTHHYWNEKKPNPVSHFRKNVTF